MSKSLTPVSGEIWHKWQRGLRTAVQTVVTGAGFLAVAVVVAPQILDALADVLPGPVVAWLAGVIAAAATLSAALSRVMAIPWVDAKLKRIGLGSAPRSATVAPPAEPLPSAQAAIDETARALERSRNNM